jgi:hypothetical protein
MTMRILPLFLLFFATLHYVSGQDFAPSEFSEEPEITQEEVPY